MHIEDYVLIGDTQTAALVVASEVGLAHRPMRQQGEPIIEAAVRGIPCNRDLQSLHAAREQLSEILEGTTGKQIIQVKNTFIARRAVP